MKVNKYQLFAYFSRVVDVYNDSKTLFYRNACVKTCIDVLSRCLDEAIDYYTDDDDDECIENHIIELAMHYACNYGVFNVNSKAWREYWIDELEGYYHTSC